MRLRVLEWMPIAMAAALVGRTSLTTAELGADTVGPEPLLRESELERCTFELIMAEDRRIPASVKQVNSDVYWSMSAILNHAYAERFGYTFQYVEVNFSKYRRSWMCRFHPAWVKLFYIEQRLQELEATNAGGRCTWLLYLDSDAFVRGYESPLPIFISQLAKKYRIRHDVALIIAEDQELKHPSKNRISTLPDFRPLRPWLNSGVFLLQAGRSARRLLRDWIAAGVKAIRDVQMAWPLEMGVLTELVRPGSWPDALPAGLSSFEGGAVHASNIAVVDMVEMNSPLGRFVCHLWGQHRYRREMELWDSLIRVGLHDQNELERHLRKTRTSILSWGPSDREGACSRNDGWRQQRRVMPPDSKGARCHNDRCEIEEFV